MRIGNRDENLPLFLFMEALHNAHNGNLSSLLSEPLKPNSVSFFWTGLCADVHDPSEYVTCENNQQVQLIGNKLY